MSNPYIGEIELVPFNFAPVGWLFCQGQTLSIAQYTALFSLLGTTFGGNGSTTFALPDLRGRVPIGLSSSSYVLGQVAGQETVTLNSTHLPTHSHTLSGVSSTGTASSPVSGFCSTSSTGNEIYQTATPNRTMAAALGATGSSVSHPNLQPYLGLNFIINTDGIYPSRP